mgnify:FL=1
MQNVLVEGMIPLDYFIALAVAVAVGGIVGHVATARSYAAYVSFLVRRIAELSAEEMPRDPEAEDEWWKGTKE